MTSFARRGAPALESLAVPLAAANLAVWGVGTHSQWSYGPAGELGKWWSGVLPGAILAFLGAVGRRRGVALLGWSIVIALVAQSLLAVEVAQQGSRFGSSLGSWGVDIPAAFAPLMLLGMAAATPLCGRGRPGDVAWAATALALIVLRPAPNGPLGDHPAETLLILGFLAAPLLAGVLARRDPVRLTIAAGLGAAAAPEAVWLLTGPLPYNGPTAALATLIGLAQRVRHRDSQCGRRAGRRASRS